MSKRRRSRPAPIAASPPAMQPQAYGQWDAALPTYDTGMIWVPQFKAAEEVDALSRAAITDRQCHLYRNNGRVRRVINCVTRLVTGTGLMPEPMTKDQRYNDAVRRLWLLDAESPKTFSLSGKFSCSRAQRALKRAQLKTGDSAMVAAKQDEGGIASSLYFALYDGTQIGDGNNPSPAMRDGVLTNEHDRALAYRLLGLTCDGKATQVDVDAQHVLFFGSNEDIGGHRGVSCMAHAINDLVTLKDIHDALGKGIRMSSYQAWVIEQQIGAPTPPGGTLGPGGGPRPTVTVEDPKTKQPITLEKFLGKGQIETLKPGQSAKILHDQRPHPNVMQWDDALMRTIIGGLDYPYEVIWKIEALGGANSRFVLADCQSKIAVDQEEMVEQILAPAYILKLQNWEERGLLPPCEDPDWWMHEWLTPARLTVDFGRDGRIFLDQWVRGHITLKTLFGFTGDAWKRQTTQWLEEIAWRKAEMKRLGLDTNDLPATSVSASIAPDQPPSPDTTPASARALANEDLELDDDLP